VNQNGLVEPSEVQLVPGTAATPSETFTRFALGLDARLIAHFPRVGAFVLRGEIVWAKNLDRGLEPADPVATGRPLREHGFTFGFTQEIGEILQVGMRYDRYDPDADARRALPVQVVPLDLSYATLAYLIAIRLPSARFLAEYDRNWNSLGRDASGAPTTLKDDAFTIRAEMVF
jgi:hypothetical protein